MIVFLRKDNLAGNGEKHLQTFKLKGVQVYLLGK